MTKCPTCHHRWSPDETAPAWKCPKCDALNCDAISHDPDVRHQWGLVNSPSYKEMFDRFHLDTSRFNDPLAAQIYWTEASVYSGNFTNHRLMQTSPSRLEFRMRKSGRLFPAAFVLAGIYLLFVMVRKADPSYMGLLSGAAFIVAGGYLLRNLSLPIVFDRSLGFFWSGKKGPLEAADDNGPQQSARLSKIHAVQLTAVVKSTENHTGSYYIAYETNLVLNNGKRLNVVGAGTPEFIREDAAILARFLNKPLWDAVDDTKKLYETLLPQIKIERAFSRYFGTDRR